MSRSYRKYPACRARKSGTRKWYKRQMNKAIRRLSLDEFGRQSGRIKDIGLDPWDIDDYVPEWRWQDFRDWHIKIADEGGWFYLERRRNGEILRAAENRDYDLLYRFWRATQLAK